MPQTNPFHMMVPRKLSDTELARALRLDLESELDAINLYAAHIDATDNEEAKRVLRHVMNEEKEHAAMFWELIARLDPKQAAQARTAGKKVEILVRGGSDEEVEQVGEGDEADPEPAGTHS